MPTNRDISPRGCGDCPFQYDSCYCLAPGSMVTLEELWRSIDSETAPATCPLRRGPITITLTEEVT